MEDFGAYLVLGGEFDAVSKFLLRLIAEGIDPVIVSPNEVEFSFDPDLSTLEPEREERSIGVSSLPLLLRSLTRHLREGRGKAVVICGLQAFKEGNDFHDLSNFVGRLYEEACVNRGLVLIFADPNDFTPQELAFLERETTVLEDPGQLFSITLPGTSL